MESLETFMFMGLLSCLLLANVALHFLATRQEVATQEWRKK